MKAALLIALALGCAADRDRGGGPSQGVHGAGILDPASADFHGVVLHELDWDFGACAQCHGAAFDGGTSGTSCLTCHTEGPTACSTCHDQSSGSHPAHLVTAGVACAECHVVPARWDDEGHLRVDGHADEAPAEVVFGALANRDVVPPRRTEPAHYDAATATCSGVYCHGGTLHDATATAPAPRWGQTGAAECGGCHGAPPANHASDRCDSCHRGAAHIDATIGVGTECSSCHGDATSPAPPRGLGGQTSPQDLAVGVHRAHVAAQTLRGPIPCATCHVVPATRDAPGHLDSPEPAEVLAAIGWDRSTATCANGCHGPARPVWNDPNGNGAACGTCHGLPPATAAHATATTLASCTTCHPSVDADGAIVFLNPDTSEHIDGDVDLR